MTTRKHEPPNGRSLGERLRERVPDWWVDAALALGMSAMAFLSLLPHLGEISPWQVGLTCAEGLVLVALRRAPVATAGVDIVLQLASLAVGFGPGGQPALVIAAVNGATSRAWIAVTVTAGLLLPWATSALSLQGIDGLTQESSFFVPIEFAVAMFLGMLARRERVALTAQQNRARHAQQCAVVAVERAHAVGVLQAAVGERLDRVVVAAREVDRLVERSARGEVVGSPPQLAVALRRVQKSAQDTLATTRHALGIVRTAPPDADPVSVGNGTGSHGVPWADLGLIVLAGALAFGPSTPGWRSNSFLRHYWSTFQIPVASVPIALFAVVAGALLVRRHYPVAALLVGMAASVGSVLIGRDSSTLGFVGNPLFGYLEAVLVFSAAAQTSARRALWCVPAAVAGFLLAVTLSPLGHGSAVFALRQSPQEILMWVVLLGAGLLVGRDRRRAAVEQRRAEAAESAIARLQERRSVARDVHDVLAHQLSGVAVQAGAAASLVNRRPGLAEEAARSIAHVLHEADRAFPRLIDGIDDMPGDLGRHALDLLTAGLRRAGAPVSITVHGVPPSAAGAADRAAARILGEALTNVLRHAGPVATTVRIAHESGRVLLTVHNSRTTGTGGGEAHPHVDPSGHGIRGMRERAELVGGELHAGADAAGWTVTATLPRGRIDER